jgi:glutamyl-tRNA synthetase
LELADATVFALKQRPLSLPDKARDLLTEETRRRLGRLREAYAAASDWTVPGLEALNRGFAESEGVGLGKIGPALRAVLSGGSPAPDLAGALVALGKDESLGRMDDALSLNG